MLACENLADHLSHFYLFFMPDFARPVYSQRPWFAEATRRFTAMAGEHARAPVAARQRGFEIMGTLGGKWPHTLSIQPGGSARAVEAAERIRLLAKVREFRAFLEATTFGAPLEEIAALDSEAALQRWHAADPLRGDLRLFLTLAADLKLDTLGRGPGRTLSFGAYRQPDGSHALAEGVWSESLGRLQPVDTGAIREDATHAWLAGDEALHPSEGLTAPMIDKPGGYTWNKAPWLSGEVVETGAIARQLASGQPLIRDAVARCRANVYTRVLARLVELARVLQMTEQWLTALAPRDTVGAPGALEAALEGTAVQPGEDTPVAVQHIVRSFDPCMVCTVH
jgi:hydrogenase large subunit